MSYRKFFHIISYLQYPIMLTGLIFAFIPYFKGFQYLKENPEATLENLNYTLILMGLGISFSTLQDTTKTQNDFSKKIWQNPKKGKIAIAVLSCITFGILIIGVFGYFLSQNEILKQFSFGIIVFGIGLIGFLKAALEIFEDHRMDKKMVSSFIKALFF